MSLFFVSRVTGRACRCSPLLW